MQDGFFTDKDTTRRNKIVCDKNVANILVTFFIQSSEKLSTVFGDHQFLTFP